MVNIIDIDQYIDPNNNIEEKLFNYYERSNNICEKLSTSLYFTTFNYFNERCPCLNEDFN